MPDAESFVPLLTARRPAEALLIKDLLENAGILVWLPGLYLADDWAASQQLMGNLAVEVRVPPDRLEEARQLLAELKEAARDMPAEEDPADGDDASS